ncbi:two component LuxR family transcriptional regulator [Caballeronia hypogeia]|uniref:Two component LuxR family transcriptional regulator n=1 Tax=Caballeronia hypogeia TaxID=1777140 RepID=A0A157ZLI4_9BURK|nr:LuxR C-terminal-related transcriptional regulator [Caballeronia hypogeia]SAK46365.1 two component LuxR family transcriptional regulator [Caballeronia hypogeia]
MDILITGVPGLFREGVAALLGRFAEDARVRVQESLDAQLADDPAPDCVVMDGDSAGRTPDQLEAVRVRARTAPVVVLLSHASQAQVGALIAAGVSGCLDKSASSDMLFDALRLALSGGVFLPRSLRAERGGEADAPRAEADAEAAPNLHLTPRQVEVLALVARGRSNKVIARELDMAEATVKTHLSAIFKLLNVTSRGEASAAAARLESIRDAQAGNASLGRISIAHLLADTPGHRFRAGDVLFRRGDAGGELFYLARGRVLLSELGIELEAGEVLGEIGVFSPERRRTATAICKTDCEMRIVGSADAIRLSYQDPEFAMYLIRLLTSRLQADNARRA